MAGLRVGAHKLPACGQTQYQPKTPAPARGVGDDPAACETAHYGAAPQNGTARGTARHQPHTPGRR